MSSSFVSNIHKSIPGAKKVKKSESIKERIFLSLIFFEFTSNCWTHRRQYNYNGNG